MTKLDVSWLQWSISVEKLQNDMCLLIHLAVFTDSARYLLIPVLKLETFYLFTHSPSRAGNPYKVVDNDQNRRFMVPGSP